VDRCGVHVPHRFELAALLAVDDASIALEHGERRNALRERNAVALRDVEVAVDAARAHVHVHDHEPRDEGRVLRPAHVSVEHLAVGAPVAAEVDEHAAIARNLRAPGRFATRSEAEAHLRWTHRDWGEIDDAYWANLVRHGIRKCEDGYRLHYDPRIAQAMVPMPFVPGLFFWSAWYRVPCPVLLVRGERSDIFPRSVASAMLASKPRAEWVEIPGAGHAPALMSEAEIETVRDFLGIEAGARRMRVSPAGPLRATMGSRTPRAHGNR